ncbi:hypothetical protein OIV83_001291 [Microbotryomycetes sp. JL201]|nr:hypothetical protein OIV83_001291 [Microbotryomycetes sp. JL201]
MPPKASAGADKTYETGDVVLGKLKGYPAWPGHIVDNESAPPKVRKEKPAKSKSSYLVQFFPTGDFAWLSARDISTLATQEIDAFLNSKGKKKADLVNAYETARDPETWKEQKAQEAAAYEAWMNELPADDNIDQLASDEESGKKRKRKSDAAEKKASGEKKAKKAKLQGGSKAEAEEKPEDKPASKKAKAGSESDSPELKQVRDWRHKLQKVFVSQKPPTSEDMTKCKEYFAAMEDFDMKKEWLAETKLAKVLKRIAQMKDGEIPDNDQYNFRGRSSALAAKWSTQVTDAVSNAPDTPQAANTSAAEESAPAPVEQPSEPTSQNHAPAPIESSGLATEAPAESKSAEPNGVAESKPAEEAPAQPNGTTEAAPIASESAPVAIESNEPKPAPESASEPNAVETTA